MNRQTLLLAVLGVVLVLVLFFLFAFRPAQQELADVQDQTEQTEDQRRQVEAQIQALETIRAEAPAIEAAVAAARSVVPGEPALPSAVRQLQMAADASGVTLTNVGVARPTAIEATDADGAVPEGLAQIQVDLAISGGYYQIVDFLRRVEDPRITPRAVLWSSLSVTAGEYPTLQATANGLMFAILPPGATVEEAAEPDVEVTVEATEGETTTVTETTTENVEVR